MNYLYRVGVAFSVLCNVILGGCSGQSFSARNREWQREGKPNMVRLIDAVFGEGHCGSAWAYWKIRERK